MKKRIYAKKVAGSLLATVIFATTISGCGKNKTDERGDAKELPEAVQDAVQEVSKESSFKLESMDGIIGEGEEVKYLDYVEGQIKIVSSKEDGKLKYISFNEDGSGVKTVDLPIDGKDMFGHYAADDEGNIYVLCNRFTIEEDVDPEEQEGVAHAGFEDEELEESENASEEASMSSGAGTFERLEYSIAKYDSTGKETFKTDISKEFPEDDMGTGIYSIHWVKNYGLVLNTSRGILKYDDKAGISTILDDAAVKEFSDTAIMMWKGADNKLFVSGYKGENGCEYRQVDLENKKVSEPYAAFDKEKYYTISGGEGYDLYANDERVIYGFDAKSDKLVELIDFQKSGIDGYVSFIVAANDADFYAVIPNVNGISRLTKVTE